MIGITFWPYLTSTIMFLVCLKSFCCWLIIGLLWLCELDCGWLADWVLGSFLIWRAVCRRCPFISIHWQLGLGDGYHVWWVRGHLQFFCRKYGRPGVDRRWSVWLFLGGVWGTFLIFEEDRIFIFDELFVLHPLKLYFYIFKSLSNKMDLKASRPLTHYYP